MSFDHIIEPDSSRCWCAPEVYEHVEVIKDSHGHDLGVQVDRMYFHFDETMQRRRDGRPRKPSIRHR